jgi:hypothetical protein
VFLDFFGLSSKNASNNFIDRPEVRQYFDAIFNAIIPELSNDPQDLPVRRIST